MAALFTRYSLDIGFSAWSSRRLTVRDYPRTSPVGWALLTRPTKVQITKITTLARREVLGSTLNPKWFRWETRRRRARRGEFEVLRQWNESDRFSHRPVGHACRYAHRSRVYPAHRAKRHTPHASLERAGRWPAAARELHLFRPRIAYLPRKSSRPASAERCVRHDHGTPSPAVGTV